MRIQDINAIAECIADSGIEGNPTVVDKHKLISRLEAYMEVMSLISNTFNKDDFRARCWYTQEQIAKARGYAV